MKLLPFLSNFFVKSLLKYDGGLLVDAIIKIDGSGDKLFREKLFTYLRQELGPGKIKKFSFADSSKDNLIQLADMVAGAIARSYKDNRAEFMKWINALRKSGNLIDVWKFR